MAATAPITQDVHTIPRKLPAGPVNLVGLTRDALRDEAPAPVAGAPSQQSAPFASSQPPQLTSSPVAPPLRVKHALVYTARLLPLSLLAFYWSTGDGQAGAAFVVAMTVLAAGTALS